MLPPANYKNCPEDFVVEEIPAYPVGGRGEHLFVEVTRRDMTTPFLIQCLARALGLPSHSFGYAGLKDRCAVARQLLSIHGLSAPPPPPSLPGLLEWRVLGWHPHKLRRGHLRGNRFQVRLGAPSHDHVEAVAERLRRQGWANYYGEQRFGRGGDNQARGRAWLTGSSRRPAGGTLDLAISAYQSFLFNLYLRRRIDRGDFGRVLAGDVCAHLPEGGMFLVEDLGGPPGDGGGSLDLEQRRLEAFEISQTGPMFGFKMLRAAGEPGRWEEELLQEEELELSDFRKLKAPGSRRRLRLPLEVETGWSWTPETGGGVMSFTLPAGSYATVFLSNFFTLAELPGPGEECLAD